MTSLLLALLCISQSHPTGKAAWPGGMSLRAKVLRLSSKSRPSSRAKATAGKKAGSAEKPRGAEVPKGISFVVADPQPGYDSTALVYEEGTVGSAEWIAMLKTLESGLSPALRAKAVDKAETYLDRYPENRASVGFRLADLYFQLGRNDDAYRLLAPLATEHASKETLLRASISASARGEVYPGQREFCVRSILDDSSSMQDLAWAMPQGNSPDAVLTLSLLATASECASTHETLNVYYYGKLALKRDPGNPLACYLLASYAAFDRRYDEAIAYLNQGAARARGELAESYRSGLRNNRHLLQAKRRTQRTNTP